jgi:hypothetical protein
MKTELQHKIKFVFKYLNVLRFGNFCCLSWDDERQAAEPFMETQILTATTPAVPSL